MTALSSVATCAPSRSVSNRRIDAALRSRALGSPRYLGGLYAQFLDRDSEVTGNLFVRESRCLPHTHEPLPDCELSKQLEGAGPSAVVIIKRAVVSRGHVLRKGNCRAEDWPPHAALNGNEMCDTCEELSFLAPSASAAHWVAATRAGSGYPDRCRLGSP